jgi:hypothetical protein
MEVIAKNEEVPENEELKEAALGAAITRLQQKEQEFAEESVRKRRKSRECSWLANKKTLLLEREIYNQAVLSL